MIKSIFYSRFHPEKGPTVLHQVPLGSISLSTNVSTKQKQYSGPQSSTQKDEQSERATDFEATLSISQPLLSFPALSDYLIPRQEFCNSLVTIAVNDLRVLGYPVCIVDREKYARNEFIFNFAVVVGAEAEVGLWSSVVRRVAGLLKEMEESGGFLSTDEEDDALYDADSEFDDNTPPRGKGKIYALCEMILEDLNNYCECMIPLDSANTLNLKVFPTYPPPPVTRGWHVPLLTVHLPSLMDRTWDLTMQRITPYIDGVNSVARISQLADADVRLVSDTVRHLNYYGCCLLLDVFQFTATYAPTPRFASFVADSDMQKECARYIAVPVSMSISATRPSTASGGLDEEGLEVRSDTILRLYAGLRQGITLKMWCIENKDLLVGVDVRRLITFGVIKGFLYRVHKYAVAPSHLTNGTTASSAVSVSNKNQKPNSYRSTKMRDSRPAKGTVGDEIGQNLSRYLDGLHCFDEICTELETSDKPLLSGLKTRGDVHIIHR